MVNSVHNAAQQAYLNPFQKDNSQVQGQREKEGEANKAESKASVGSNSVVQASGKEAESRQDVFKASGASEQSSSRSQSSERGSIIDITV